MPTYGWIVETAQDRYDENRPYAPGAPSRSIVFTCSQCGAVVASVEELRQHVNLSHPLALPALYLFGKPVPKETVIRAPIKESDTNLVFCSRCEVQEDGGVWENLTLKEFQKRIGRTMNAIWNVRLIHERLSTGAQSDEQYRIQFRIPTSAHLNFVDEHFIKTLALEEISHSDLDRFEAGLPMDVAAREYGHALGNYALGILLKERRHLPRSTTEFAEFSGKLRSALETLWLFQRPVALAVVNAIRFNLNDFAEEGGTRSIALDGAFAFFHHKSGWHERIERSANADSRNQMALSQQICPVDYVTYCLISDAVRLSDSDKSAFWRPEQLLQLLSGAYPVSSFDLAKVHVLCAEGFSRLDRADEARVHLRAVQFDPVFGTWAHQQLGEM